MLKVKCDLAYKNVVKNYDTDKVIINEGIKRTSENCEKECLATLYCEHCVRNYLKARFSNWTSGNNDINNLIQECQIKTLIPDGIVEWVPYNNLLNVKYLTKGGFSEIYTALNRAFSHLRQLIIIFTRASTNNMNLCNKQFLLTILLQMTKKLKQ